MKRVLYLLLAFTILLSVILTGCSEEEATPATPKETTTQSLSLPWEDGSKLPEDYTYEEFEKLTAEQQLAFQKTFESPEDFNSWLLNAEKARVEVPWDNGGKQPVDYTWEEFEALSDEQKMVFQNSFEDNKDFEEWYYRVTQ